MLPLNDGDGGGFTLSTYCISASLLESRYCFSLLGGSLNNQKRISKRLKKLIPVRRLNIPPIGKDWFKNVKYIRKLYLIQTVTFHYVAINIYRYYIAHTLLLCSQEGNAHNYLAVYWYP